MHKQKVFEINGRLAAIGCDNSVSALEQNQSRVFLLGSDGKMFHLLEAKELEEEFKCSEVVYFTKRKFFNKPWNMMYLIRKGTYAKKLKVSTEIGKTEKNSRKSGLTW